MNAKFILQNVEELCDLNLLNNFKNKEEVSLLQIDPLNYALFIYSSQSCRISIIKLCLKKLDTCFNDDITFNSNDCASKIKFSEIYLLNVFCLPFTLLNLICTKRSVWAIGQETVVNLTPYVEQALHKAKSLENDDSMDVDVIEEFQPNMVDIDVEVSVLEKYNLHVNDIFVGCDFLDYGLIRCHKNSKLCIWELEFLFSNDREISADVMALSFLNFPISYNTSCLNIPPNQDKNKSLKPSIVFIHHSDPENLMFRNIFGINCVFPNVICLIGHPEGKLLWSLCDLKNHFQAPHGFQSLFSTKQAIVGIFFIKDIEGLKGCDCILLVGALGQLTLISSKRYPSFTHESDGNLFWTKTVHLSSSITYCEVLKDYLLSISNVGALLLSNLSEIFHPSDKNAELIVDSSFSEFEHIEEMLIADHNKGLILLRTKYGSLYLTQLKKRINSETVTLSLPSLMNECLKQSNKMQDLLNKKVLQNRLFAAISTFASFKFLKNILKEPVTFSISEVNEQLKKYVLVINFKCLDSLNLDPELCHVTSTIFTFFKNNNSFVTKSTPYKADEPTLCLELIDTVLQPPFVSIFPLFIEVGLILQLPENWKTINCFKAVSNFLPFYIRIQTFMIHELNLLQNNALCFPQSLKFETSMTLKTIMELGMKRPVSNALKINYKNDFNLFKKYNLCLSASSVEEMLKNTCDSDPCKYIEKLLFGNLLQNNITKESYIMSKCSPISINVSKSSGYIVITLTANNSDSVIGLRIAVMEILLASYRESKQTGSSSSYVNIPVSIYRRCEEILKSLENLYGKDVESDEVMHQIVNLYKELRIDVSEKLPVL